MFTSFEALKNNHRRGMTLIELMIVVAIVGILAAIGGVAFKRQLTSAKITKLEAVAQEAALGQNDPLRNTFYPPPNGATAEFVYSATADASNANKKKLLSTFLKVQPSNIEPGMVLNVSTGAANSNCSANYCTAIGFTSPSDNGRWFVVSVSQDMDGDPSTGPTRVIKRSDQKNVIVVNKGQ